MFKATGAFNTFTEFLNLATKERIMTFEEAVRKITIEPARKLGLVGRGIVKEGYIADLTGIKEGEVKFTIVNGILAYKESEFRGWFPGRILRHRISTT
jgi:N-acyl-D-aspartate/D-glutamate deacylase